MKKNILHLICCTLVLTFSLNGIAKENLTNEKGKSPAPKPTPANELMVKCAPAVDKADLDINNVRTTILTGGDMWWDLLNGKYFVPKPAKGTVGTTALFAGSLWIGGQDIGGSLKVAGMTYRQTGNDFWPGPLNDSVSITATQCAQWDKHFTINRADVETYYYWVTGPQSTPNPTPKEAMDVIKAWPTIGYNNHSLAPFWDINGNGVYDYEQGEIPDFDILGTRGCDAQLFGDQNMFWVFNDAGNIHTESLGTSIGLEVQAQGFAFKTTDEINNMTFYRYKIINRSSSSLYNTYFGVWCDPDLGSGTDDYVGCDVELGLGFCYNGDLVDDNPFPGQIPYGANPPAIGIDFFEGPFADSNGVDDNSNNVPKSFLNYSNGKIDDERIGMAKFVYYNNDVTSQGNPVGALNFYNYLKGIWRDGSSITYGGNGHLTGVPCSYMFPGNSDPRGFGTNMVRQNPWDEASSGNDPFDRRFLQSAGPFTLRGGAVNTITIGVVWARTTQGGNLASVGLMKGADSKAQKLFNACFKTLDGPTAPILNIQELENQLILTWTNPETSNNYQEKYSEDADKASTSDKPFVFEGYKIYQLKDGTVSVADLYNIDKARLVLQCDVQNNISQIVNYTPDLSISALVPKEMVNGANKGVVHSASITEDKFAVGNTKLVNHKTYYYAIVAYANSVQPNSDSLNLSKLEEWAPYLQGRLSADKGAFAHSAIPHAPSPEEGGTKFNAVYGSGPKITRVEGHGNGGNILDITDESANDILKNNLSARVQYENGRGPVAIKVVDPLNVPQGNFRLTFSGTDDNSTWTLIDIDDPSKKVTSDNTFKNASEQIINGQPTGQSNETFPRWGISVYVKNIVYPGSVGSVNNGFIEATMEFADPSKKWLSGIPDLDVPLTNFNWIRSGNGTFPGADAGMNDYLGLDDTKAYQNILKGTWAPYRMCASSSTSVSIGGPSWDLFQTTNLLKNLASVDVVITSDKSKWTRCPVLELQEDPLLADGNVKKLNLRSGGSVDKNGNSQFPSADNDDFATGMGWFPGYAINVETGERLNMAFGEDSFLKTDNGADMIWNPTTSTMDFNSSAKFGNPLFGGKHYIYVFGHNGELTYLGSDPYKPNQLRNVPRYDKGKFIHDMLTLTATYGTIANKYKRDVFADAMWVNIPILSSANAKLLDTDVKIRLRVGRPYKSAYAVDSASVDLANPAQNNNNPMYEFSLNDLTTEKNHTETAKSYLDQIGVVPNPYYAYSGYEKSGTDNVVKFVNLPKQCSINIYTLNGTLIRKLKKDDSGTYLNWDLKNQANIPIASGMYIIHIDAPGIGEKILKWFGVMRPIDLDAY